MIDPAKVVVAPPSIVKVAAPRVTLEVVEALDRLKIVLLKPARAKVEVPLRMMGVDKEKVFTAPAARVVPVFNVVLPMYVLAPTLLLRVKVPPVVNETPPLLPLRES